MPDTVTKTGEKELSPRRLFMTGGAAIVPPDRSGAFCRQVVDGCMEGTIDESFFALGFAAAVDAVARGSFSVDDDPADVVRRAYGDVCNVTNEPNAVTDIMRECAAVRDD